MLMQPLVPAISLALAFAPAATAAKPTVQPKPAAPVTLDAKPAMLVFSGATTLSGQLGGGSAAGVTVRLEEDSSRPYGDSYKPAGATAMTASNGKYTFAVKPPLNTQYRVVAQTSPPITSAPKLVLVRMLVGLSLSDPTPARGSLVRFSGSVYPAHDGRTVQIQKRSPTGRFVTVSRTILRDAGDAKSTYSRRVRAFRDGTYRVKVAGDGDHINGFSRLRTIDVPG